ncbi:MAG: hypothetical protein V4714_07865 [Bacteroidota bacterium]
MKPAILRIYIFFVFFIFCADVFQASGQSKRRIELESDNGNCQIVPISENGLVLFSETAKDRINFKKYDANLEQIWTIDCQVNPSLDIVQYTYDGSLVYLLLATSKSSNYQIIKVSTDAGFAERIDIFSLNRLDITEFKAHLNDAYIAGKVKNDPVLLHINLLTKQTKLLPFAYKGTADIQSLEIEKETGLINVTVAVRQSKTYSVIVKSFAPEGMTVRNVLIEPEVDRSLLTGRLVPLSDSLQLVIGTYGLRNSAYTQGMYITKLVDNAPQKTKYYSFTDFKNFFKFMDSREQARIEKKIKSKKKKGDDLKLQYRLLVHDIIQKDGQYIMVAEAYYPEYRYRNNNFYPGYGGMGGFGYPYSFGRYGYSPFGYGYPYNNYGNTGQVFDGYKYTHAVVAGFDPKGDLLWDNSFEFADIKTLSLKEKVKVNVQADHIALLYSHNGYIKSKVIRGNEVVEGVTNTPISTDYEGDKVKKNYTDELEYWYGNYFAAWGYQKIKNSSDQQVKNNRSVFYVNKIAF